MKTDVTKKYSDTNYINSFSQNRFWRVRFLPVTSKLSLCRKLENGSTNMEVKLAIL